MADCQLIDLGHPCRQGALITSDADSGSGANFLISRSLAAGRYYVRVEGADGAYGISIND